MLGASLIFLIMIIVVIGVPCVGIGFIGYHMMTRLGRYPSKTPAITLSVFIKLVVIEVISFALLIAFFRIFSD